MGKRTVIVTGAASGIGKGIAEKFAEEGSKLLLVDIKEQLLNETKQHLAAAYPDAEIKTAAGDLTSADFVEQIIAECKAAFESVNVLVNCAGIFPSTPFLQISREEWSRVIGLNLSATFFLTQAIARLMVETKPENANIINISSTASEVARPGVAHYCSSKAGVKMLTQVLALELAPHSIRVNAVGPGLVETEALLGTLNNEKAIAEHNEKVSFAPLNRTAELSEIAAAVYFIASKEASYITGQNLLVDGGYSAGRVFKSFS
ncbi:SDR family NAD(P)-dependent oxidoreductase [Planomicrobium sp. CPCC 101110]|uniref:SDR family NAD(P)-dependent oxidoreductase n=1 Tax=Planomicrobium sp. CPCC 101110 TaxID=2599619 RepID=UPI0011B66A1A|nr:SDR family oxidoreductase [Planomicrobium sp. CPCC 101110]TWT25353.1 SDR family oxidoreductase [Planomicrobium sp. CPCC 101110]